MHQCDTANLRAHTSSTSIRTAERDASTNLQDKPRLVQVEGIYCEAPLSGHVIFLKNEDVPGVIGYVGGVFGKNGINIANFSLGRQEKPVSEGQPLEAVSVIETDHVVPDSVLVEVLKNPAVKMARLVEFN